MLIGADAITCIDSTGTKVEVTEAHLAEVPDLAAGSGTGTTGITAYAGGGQGSATALTAAYNNVTVVATDNDSVKLPTPSLGKRCVVKNSDSAQILAVYPASGHTINGASANDPVYLPPGALVTFWGSTTSAWQADLPVRTVGDQTVGGVKTFSSAPRTSVNVGAANTGTTAVEYGDGMTHKTVLTVNTTLPAIAGGANLGVGKLLYTFPAGAIIVDGAYMSLAITQSQGNITADTPDGGLGTVIASGVVATLDGTGTFEDILTGQTFNDCNGTAEVKTAIPTGGVPLVIEAGAAHTVYFNVADGWAASGDAAATLTGTVVLSWRFMN